MLTETQDSEEIIARVAALDIGKAELVCCVRVPDEDRPGRRLQEVETYATMTRSLLSMADHLRCLGVSRVVMEATSDYWKPVVRHEALFDRAGVRGLRRRAVAAA
jgi:transposase